MDNSKGVIFNIQKFSIHDGVGIRTLVFMKGCPLRCIWCSNPESQNPGVEIMDVKAKCSGCGKCVSKCQNDAIEPNTYDINRDICIKCGNCTQFCFAECKKIVGQTVTINELMKIIEKDRVFYRNSGGGVTVGGGEPTMQSGFVTEFLKACRKAHIHTAIETCGYGAWERIESVFEYTDQVFFDLKCMDNEAHKNFTGVENTTILCNAANVAEMNKEVVFRVPLVPGINDSDDNIRKTGAFVKDLAEYNNNISIELLPYHNFGKDKYKWLNVEYKLEDTMAPLSENVSRYNEMLLGMGLNVIR